MVHRLHVVCSYREGLRGIIRGRRVRTTYCVPARLNQTSNRISHVFEFGIPYRLGVRSVIPQKTILSPTWSGGCWW